MCGPMCPRPILRRVRAVQGAEAADEAPAVVAEAAEAGLIRAEAGGFRAFGFAALAGNEH